MRVKINSNQLPVYRIEIPALCEEIDRLVVQRRLIDVRIEELWKELLNHRMPLLLK